MSKVGRLCKAVTATGKPCQAYALEGSEYCFQHDPARAAERTAARSKGGKARHGRVLAGGDPDTITLETVQDVIELIRGAVADVLTLENSIARARAIGALSTVAIQAMKVGELEERLEALEERLQTLEEPA